MASTTRAFTTEMPTRPGLYYRRRLGSSAPPTETVLYYAGDELVFEIRELRLGEAGTLAEHDEEVFLSEVSDAYIWYGPLESFDGESSDIRASSGQQ